MTHSIGMPSLARQSLTFILLRLSWIVPLRDIWYFDQFRGWCRATSSSKARHGFRSDDLVG
jgi:hypothetical protein